MTVDLRFNHRVLKATPETLSVQFYADGAVADPGTTTVGIVNAAGTTVVASGTATGGATTAPRTYALTSTHSASLDILTVTFTTVNYGVQVCEVEVVGAHLFDILEARSFEGSAMSDTTAYPQVDIEAKRSRIADEFDELCGVSFVPRYERVILSGHDAGTSRRFLPLLRSDSKPAQRIRTLRAIDYREQDATTWTAFTATELAAVTVTPDGELYREDGGTWDDGWDNVRVGYEHGYTRPPLAIRDAALTLCRYLLVPSNLSDRALQQTAQYGSVQVATAGKYGSEFGLPQLDRVLAEYGAKVPALA